MEVAGFLFPSGYGATEKNVVRRILDRKPDDDEKKLQYQKFCIVKCIPNVITLIKF
jgi:hypothetical protein